MGKVSGVNNQPNANNQKNDDEKLVQELAQQLGCSKEDAEALLQAEPELKKQGGQPGQGQQEGATLDTAKVQELMKKMDTGGEGGEGQPDGKVDHNEIQAYLKKKKGEKPKEEGAGGKDGAGEEPKAEGAGEEHGADEEQKEEGDVDAFFEANDQADPSTGEKDGALSLDEWKAGGGDEQSFKKANTDGDNKVSKAEAKQYVKEGNALPKAKDQGTPPAGATGATPPTK
jgi:hypothetical protein